MSLYIGYDNDNKPLLSITKNQHSEAEHKGKVLQDAYLDSRLPYVRITDIIYGNSYQHRVAASGTVGYASKVPQTVWDAYNRGYMVLVCAVHFHLEQPANNRLLRVEVMDAVHSSIPYYWTKGYGTGGRTRKLVGREYGYNDPTTPPPQQIMNGNLPNNLTALSHIQQRGLNPGVVGGYLTDTIPYLVYQVTNIKRQGSSIYTEQPSSREVNIARDRFELGTITMSTSDFMHNIPTNRVVNSDDTAVGNNNFADGADRYGMIQHARIYRGPSNDKTSNGFSLLPDNYYNYLLYMVNDCKSKSADRLDGYLRCHPMFIGTDDTGNNKKEARFEYLYQYYNANDTNEYLRVYPLLEPTSTIASGKWTWNFKPTFIIGSSAKFAFNKDPYHLELNDSNLKWVRDSDKKSIQLAGPGTQPTYIDRGAVSIDIPASWHTPKDIVTARQNQVPASWYFVTKSEDPNRAYIYYKYKQVIQLEPSAKNLSHLPIIGIPNTNRTYYFQTPTVQADLSQYMSPPPTGWGPRKAQNQAYIDDSWMAGVVMNNITDAPRGNLNFKQLPKDTWVNWLDSRVDGVFANGFKARDRSYGTQVRYILQTLYDGNTLTIQYIIAVKDNGTTSNFGASGWRWYYRAPHPSTTQYWINEYNHQENFRIIAPAIQLNFLIMPLQTF